MWLVACSYENRNDLISRHVPSETNTWSDQTSQTLVCIDVLLAPLCVPLLLLASVTCLFTIAGVISLAPVVCVVFTLNLTW